MDLQTNQPKPKKNVPLLPHEEDKLRYIKNAFNALPEKVQEAFKAQLQ